MLSFLKKFILKWTFFVFDVFGFFLPFKYQMTDMHVLKTRSYTTRKVKPQVNEILKNQKSRRVMACSHVHLGLWISWH